MAAFLGLLCLVASSTALPQPGREHNDGLVLPASPHAQHKLHGRFLHITDFHPDPFYKTYSSTDEDSVCHRRSGPAGFYGAETSDCDTPLSLVNATFKWIEENIKDTIDFVVWTGDSARHDNDERIPRSDVQVAGQNELIASKFYDVFQKPDNDNDTDPTNDLTIPIVPTLGNNDVLPHNIFEKGPNRWTLKYLEIWRRFIPEEQRHQFQRGGWFYVEVVPGKLAVFSLNTLYFFDSNSAVDGCASKKAPGYEQFEWLRIQLQFMRERGMKAILMGHVPPARTENKMSWDESCWQKYALWMQQYRDVIVTQLFGHMNINHFMFQDFNEIDKDISRGIAAEKYSGVAILDDELTIASATDYLIDLRNSWAKIPAIPPPTSNESILSRLYDALFGSAAKRGKKGKSVKGKQPRYDKIGGPWAERYGLSHVGSSVVPNYFPTLRIYEYNTTGLDKKAVVKESAERPAAQMPLLGWESEDEAADEAWVDTAAKKKKKHKFKVPQPPSKSAPPGPAYSPQTFSLLGYRHYYANLTHINNDFTNEHGLGGADEQKWKEGKHKGKNPKKIHDEPHPRPFRFEEEYNTFDDEVFGLEDLTVRSYLDLARRIGSRSAGKHSLNEEPKEQSRGKGDGKEKKKKKKGKGGKKHKRTTEWYTFLQRAFVETVDPATIERLYPAAAAEIEEL